MDVLNLTDVNATCAAACELDESCVSTCYEGTQVHAVQPTYFLYALGLILMSGLFSGLTLGLMSLDTQGLMIVIAGGDPVEKRQAERILPVRQRGNQLLCTLLIGNTLVNAMLAILIDNITSSLSAVLGTLLSTVFILIFGEIIPQSFCSRYGLAAGSKTADLVGVIMFVLYPVAKPIAMVLDRLLGAELGQVYSKNELKELIRAQAGIRRDAGDPASPTSVYGGPSGHIKAAEATYMCAAPLRDVGASASARSRLYLPLHLPPPGAAHSRCPSAPSSRS